MSKTPKEIWCSSGLYYDYVTDWSEGSWCRNNDGGVKYVRADRIEELELAVRYEANLAQMALDAREELEAKLDQAQWLLCDALIQLREGKIETRRNRADLIDRFLAELKGQ